MGRTMKSMNSGATWFIPCSTMQANSARYALAMIKRVASAPGFLNELSSRKESLSNQIFDAIMHSNGKFSNLRHPTTVKYALSFNFNGQYINDHRGEGLILSFFMPDPELVGTAYMFSPESAAVFTQAVLDVCGIDEEVEITYSYLRKEGDLKSGCYSITKEYLEHFPTDKMQPWFMPIDGELYYALCLNEPHPCLPSVIPFSLDASKIASIPFKDTDSVIPKSVIENSHLYTLKKLSYFEYDFINAKKPQLIIR
jgi:hypothetical protein